MCIWYHWSNFSFSKLSTVIRGVWRKNPKLLVLPMSANLFINQESIHKSAHCPIFFSLHIFWLSLVFHYHHRNMLSRGSLFTVVSCVNNRQPFREASRFNFATGAFLYQTKNEQRREIYALAIIVKGFWKQIQYI